MKLLSITVEEFRELYQGTPVVGLEDLLYRFDGSAEHFLEGMRFKLFRLNAIYSIVNKKGEVIPFRMNRAQHKVYAQSLRHPRLVILKSRQQGISTFYLVNFLDDAVTIPDLQVGLLLQNRAAATKMLARAKRVFELIRPEHRELLGIKDLKADNATTLKLDNNSSLEISTSFRSATLHRLHISEIGEIAQKYPLKLNELLTGTMQAIYHTNPFVIESTAKGRNHFYKMWNDSVRAQDEPTDDDFIPVFLSWIEDPTCRLGAKKFTFSPEEEQYFSDLHVELEREQKVFYAARARKLGKHMFQEYPSVPDEAFYADKSGTFYAELFELNVRKQGRIMDNLYDPNIPVQVSIDLGVDGYFVLCFFQVYNHPSGYQQFHIIDEFFSTGESLKYYADYLHNWEHSNNIKRVIVPHDMNQRELGIGKTRFKQWQEYGITNMFLLDRGEIHDGIEQVMGIIPELRIDRKCRYLIECFDNHSREWDERREIWKEKQESTELTHGADAIRYMAIGAQLHETKPIRKQHSGARV